MKLSRRKGRESDAVEEEVLHRRNRGGIVGYCWVATSGHEASSASIGYSGPAIPTTHLEANHPVRQPGQRGGQRVELRGPAGHCHLSWLQHDLLPDLQVWDAALHEQLPGPVRHFGSRPRPEDLLRPLLHEHHADNPHLDLRRRGRRDKPRHVDAPDQLPRRPSSTTCPPRYSGKTAITTTDPTLPLNPDLLVVETYAPGDQQYIHPGIIAGVEVVATSEPPRL